MSSKLNLAIQKVFDKDLQPLLKRSLVLGSLANTKFDKDIISGGDTVKMLYEGDVTVSDYAGAGITYNDSNLSSDEIRIDQKPYATFRITDIEAAQLMGDQAKTVLDAKVQRAAYKFKKHIDDNLATLYTKAGILYATSGTGSLGGTGLQITKSSVADFLADMQVKFDEADIMEENRFAVLPPWVIGMLTKSDANQYTETGVEYRKAGFAGEYAGFKVYKSNSIYNDGTNWYPLFGVEGESFALATQKQPKVEDASRPDYFENAKKMLMLYGFGCHRSDKLGTAKIIK